MSGSTVSWTITSYSLIFGSLLLFGGRAADLLGRRRMFLTGLGVFTARRSPRRWPAPRRRSSRRAPARASARRCSPPPRSRSSRPPSTARAGEGARGLGRGRRRRCRDRRPRRRRPHRGRRLAADLLREHPRRDRARGRRARRSIPARRRASRAGAASTCLARCSPPQPRHARLRDHPGGRRRLELDADDRPDGRGGFAGLVVLRRLGAPHRRSRCCGSSGSPTAPSAAGSS